jgi:nucleoside-diphosphate-sugar epimerase
MGPLGLAADRVLVSGGSGWLGTALLQALVAGLPDDDGPPDSTPEVRAQLLPGEALRLSEDLTTRVDVVSGDVRSRADCDRLCEGASGSVLFHTAGVIHPARIRDFHAVNVRGTQNILDAAVAAGVRRAVIVSSNSPFGSNPHPDHRFDEESPYNPYMQYGRSKMLMEQTARRFRDDGSLEIVIIRAPWFYGPFQPARQTLFFRMIRDGRAPLVGDGDWCRSMTYVDNLCQGLLLAAASERASGEAYWIADARPYSMREVIDVVEHLLESEFDQRCSHGRMRLPGIASDVARGADWTLQRVGLYNQKIHVLSEMNLAIACSIQKARDELGYEPRVALEEGMRRSLAYVFETQGEL